MTPTQAQNLRRLAEAATSGPWEYRQTGQSVWAESVGGCRLEHSKFMLADIRGWGHLQYLPNGAEIQDANGGFIAAMSPDVALSLLAERAMLLTSLKEFIDATEGVILQGGCVIIDSTSSGWFDRARATIKQCEGTQP